MWRPRRNTWVRSTALPINSPTRTDLAMELHRKEIEGLLCGTAPSWRVTDLLVHSAPREEHSSTSTFPLHELHSTTRVAQLLRPETELLGYLFPKKKKTHTVLVLKVPQDSSPVGVDAQHKEALLPSPSKNATCSRPTTTT